VISAGGIDASREKQRDVSLVDVLVEDPRWKAMGLVSLAEKAAQAALEHLGLKPSCFEISLLACSDARIAALNADFRGKPAPTNVLSWPSEERGADAPGGQPYLPTAHGEDAEELGDIAIAYETCRREAEQAGRDPSAHVCHLLVHGVLHLLGYDHMTEEDAALMEGLEVEILATMGIDDPY
jgi:probable rRNA maturation factor